MSTIAGSNAQLAISSRSRYKDTTLYQNNDGRLEWALCDEPAEFVGPQPSGSPIHHVTSNQVGFPDLIAVAWYGAGYEDMGVEILWANGVISAEYDMYPGMVLVIPPLSVVKAFQQRKGNGST